MSVLPWYWSSVPIGNLCKLINGRAFKPSDWEEEGLPIVRIQNLNDPHAGFNYYSKLVEEKFLIDQGQLLFAWSGTPGTSFGAHIWKRGKAVLNQHIFKVEFDESKINKKYFCYAINQKLNELIEKAHGGVGLRHVTKGKFEQTEIPLPPFNEQKRIVAKIEELFSELDKGIESLKTAREQLKVYRQAILKHAFEGKLTTGWRDIHSTDATDSQVIRVGRKNASDIPDEFTQLCADTWTWMRLGSISKVAGGLTKNPKRQKFPLKMKYLRVANVYADRIFLDDLLEIGVTDEEFDAVRLVPGDLLVVEGNGSVGQIGRVAVWDGQLSDVGHQNHLIRVRLFEGMNPRFFLYFLMSPLGRELIVKKASSTSGLHTLSISKVSSLPVPVPSTGEQSKIVRLFEVQMSIIENLESTIEAELQRSEAVRQAILKKAFSGKLVAQDPNDESASVLLERIRAEKEAQSGKQKTKQKHSDTVLELAGIQTDVVQTSLF